MMGGSYNEIYMMGGSYNEIYMMTMVFLTYTEWQFYFEFGNEFKNHGNVFLAVGGCLTLV
jgi:hypothetical protein